MKSRTAKSLGAEIRADIVPQRQRLHPVVQQRVENILVKMNPVYVLPVRVGLDLASLNQVEVLHKGEVDTASDAEANVKDEPRVDLDKLILTVPGVVLPFDLRKTIIPEFPEKPVADFIQRVNLFAFDDPALSVFRRILAHFPRRHGGEHFPVPVYVRDILHHLPAVRARDDIANHEFEFIVCEVVSEHPVANNQVGKRINLQHLKIEFPEEEMPQAGLEETGKSDFPFEGPQFLQGIRGENPGNTDSEFPGHIIKWLLVHDGLYYPDVRRGKNVVSTKLVPVPGKEFYRVVLCGDNECARPFRALLHEEIIEQLRDPR